MSKTRQTQDQSTFRELKRTALKGLSSPHSTRTNQFEVGARLAGLEEKFRILNNDQLADALRLRLDELSACSNRWTPEILALFVNLADRPAEKSSLEDLERLRPEPLPATLTWSEILADDPLDNTDGLWNDIDYTAGDSGDEEYIHSGRTPSLELTPDSSIESDDSPLDVEGLTIPNEPVRLDDILKARFWKEDEFQSCQPSKRLVNEEQVFREVLFMLHGLPTSIFVQIEDGSYLFSKKFHVDHISEGSLSHLLSEFAVLGNNLAVIRSWLNRVETVSLQQTFQTAIASRLRDFSRILSTIEASILDHHTAAMTSLLELSSSVSRESRYVQQLGEIIEKLVAPEQMQGPFDMLEMIYERTCANQSCGDAEGYRYMGELFFEGFRTYLKSVQRWMESGDLDEPDEVLFVKKKEYAVPLGSLWTEQYTVLEIDTGDLYAPKFLHLAAKKILNTGKSVNFLKALGQRAYEDITTPMDDYGLTFEVVSGGEPLATLTTFSELFELALNQWISRRYHSSSSILRQQLESQCHLQDTLDVLEYVFFHRDGARSSNFVSAISDRIDRDEGVWNDNFILTEMMREALGPLLGAASRRLTVRSSSDQSEQYSKGRSVRILGSLQVCYSFPWSLANVIRQESLVTYQRIFVILLQAQRARHALAQQQLERTTLPAIHCQNGELALARSLRHRLLWFINCILTYLTGRVLAVSTTEMRGELAKAEDMDKMIIVHSDYMLRLEEQCLLSERHKSIHQALLSLFDLGISFADAHAAYASQVFPKLISQSARWALNDHQAPPVYRRRASSFSSDDSLDVKEESEEQRIETFTETTYLYRLKRLHATFTKLHRFVLAGLQGVHRAGTEPTWESLAELLAVTATKENKFWDSDG